MTAGITWVLLQHKHRHFRCIYLFLYLQQTNVPQKSESRSFVSDFVTPYSPWNSPGQNTGEGSLSLLQGIFPAQGLNPGLPHCRQILYELSHKGSPRKGQLLPFEPILLLVRNEILQDTNYEQLGWYQLFLFKNNC